MHPSLNNILLPNSNVKAVILIFDIYFFNYMLIYIACLWRVIYVSVCLGGLQVVPVSGFTDVGIRSSLRYGSCLTSILTFLKRFIQNVMNLNMDFFVHV